MDIRESFEKVLEEFSSGNYRVQVEKAKNEFFSMSGVVYDDSPLYLERMNLFLDWYVFDRPLDDEDMTPAALFYDRYRERLTSDEDFIYGGMTRTISSLFMVKAVTDDHVAVKDMFIGKKYRVGDSYVLSLVNKGDIFQGRLVPVKRGYVFAKGFCFHDQDARPYIESEIRKIRNMSSQYHQAFMMKLALMKVKVDEYSHVPITHIYSEQPKVRF